MSNLQGKLGVKEGLPPDASGAKSVYKRRREESEVDSVIADAHESETGEGSITRIKFEDDIDETMEIKIEPETMESDAETVLEGPSTGNIDDNGLNEHMIYYTEVKTEVQDDPLMEDASASFQAPLGVALKSCDEGFVPAHSHSLPRVGSLAVADFLATARGHHEREALLAVTKHSSDENSRRRRATYNQLETLWEVLNSHKEIATGFNKSAQAREFSRRMWESVAEALNSQGEGAVKDWKGWSSYWVDYKAKLKRRAALVHASENRTGGGPMDVAPLTEIEKKFLGLLGDRIGIGLPNIQVDPFPTLPQPSCDSLPSLAIESIETEGSLPIELEQIPYELPQEEPPEVPQPQPDLATTQTVVNSPEPQPAERRRRRRRTETSMSQEAARRTLVELSRERLQLEARNAHTWEKVLSTLERIATTLDRPIEDLNESIGFVQLRRADDTCVVKCTVASRTVEYKCELTYDETDDAVLNCACECRQLACLHLLAMLVWLHSKMDCPGDRSYWSEPMVRLPRAMTLKQMYGIPERPRKIDNTVLEQFLSMCQETQDFSPGIMRYYCEDERTKCSLHKLACKFSGVRGRGPGDAGAFLAFCRDHITDKDCEIAERETQNSLEIKREILYGRIDERIAYEITKVPPGDAGAIVETILYPDDEKKDDIPTMVVEVLEKTMNIKIMKRGTLIDRTAPTFAVTPYGTTPTHVVHIKKLDNSATLDKNRKLTMLETTSAQLQMYFAKKDFGYMCVFKDLSLDVKVVKLNKVYCANLVEKCAEFWKMHVFKRIIMDEN